LTYLIVSVHVIDSLSATIFGFMEILALEVGIAIAPEFLFILPSSYVNRIGLTVSHRAFGGVGAGPDISATGHVTIAASGKIGRLLFIQVVAGLNVESQ